MEYKVINTDGYRQIMSDYHVGSLTAKAVSAMNYTTQEMASFFMKKSTLFIVTKVLKRSDRSWMRLYIITEKYSFTVIMTVMEFVQLPSW